MSFHPCWLRCWQRSCFVAGLVLPEHGRQQDPHAHLVGLELLWGLDHLTDDGRDGGLAGGGRYGGGPVVGSRDVVQPDGTRELKHGVDVLFVVSPAGSDDDARHQDVVYLSLGDEALFLCCGDGFEEPGLDVPA